MSEAGLITLDGFGPYGDGDHTINERACKTSFIRRIDEMSKVLIQFSKLNSNSNLDILSEQVQSA